jgi:hypothetical protein
VDAAFMQVERHERGIHALRRVANVAGVMDVRFRRAPQSAARYGPAPSPPAAINAT